MPDTEKFENLMAKIFEGHREDVLEESGRAEFERQRCDFAFHMTDWSHDLERMADLLRQPDRVDLEEARTFVIGFLYHVVPHLNAAGRLLLEEIRDPFTRPGDDPSHHAGTKSELR
jgi:hypothetical protein